MDAVNNQSIVSGYQYFDRFSQYPIKKLINGYSEIELGLIEDLRNTVDALVYGLRIGDGSGYNRRGAEFGASILR